MTTPSPAPRCPVGAHIPVAGGLARTGLPYTDEVGAEAVQVFVANPRGWATPVGDPRQDETFAAGCAERSLPAFVHAPYLINFGSPTEATLERSALSLWHSLRRGAAIGARGVVVHTGSAVADVPRDRALRQVGELVRPLLDQLDGLADRVGAVPDLLLEPTAGQGRSLCSLLTDLGPYLEVLEFHPRVGVCLDTCHAFAAGHDLAAPGGVDAAMTELVAAVGPDRLKLVHANDSLDVCGARRDRHQSIGTGHIGQQPFADLLAHPVVRGVPWVVETPGGAAGHGGDVALLKKLRDQARRPAGSRGRPS